MCTPRDVKKEYEEHMARNTRQTKSSQNVSKVVVAVGLLDSLDHKWKPNEDREI